MKATIVDPRKSVLVAPRSPEALAEGVEKIYRGEVESTSKKVFAWDKCIEKTLRIHREVLNVKQR